MNTFSVRRVALPAAAVLTVGLTLTACGNSDSSSSTSSGGGGGTINGGGAMSYERRPGAHTGAGGRGFTAGVAAANHHNVEFSAHWRVVAEAGGGVKISLILRNVSRETSANR